MFAWIDAARMSPVAADMRTFITPARRLIPRPILFSAPDALWVYATTAAMILHWRSAPAVDRWSSIWIASAALLAGGAEFGQAPHFVPGTFDVVDVLACTVAACAAWLVVRADYE